MKKLLLILSVILTIQVSYAAIALDQATAITTGTTATLTYQATTTGSNMIRFVGVSIRNTRTITAITYNSVAMTFAASSTSDGNVSYLYYIINPSTGANTVSITQSVSDKIVSASVSYSGVAQTSPIDATSSVNTTSTTTYSQSVTTVANNCWAVIWGMATSASTLTAGSNTVIRDQPEAFFTGGFLADTNSAKTPAGVDTMNFSSTLQNYTGAMASFKPFVSTVNTGSFFRFQNYLK